MLGSTKDKTPGDRKDVNRWRTQVNRLVCSGGMTSSRHWRKPKKQRVTWSLILCSWASHVPNRHAVPIEPSSWKPKEASLPTSCAQCCSSSVHSPSHKPEWSPKCRRDHILLPHPVRQREPEAEKGQQTWKENRQVLFSGEHISSSQWLPVYESKVRSGRRHPDF